MYNTSNKTYLSKSKITDFKNDLKKYNEKTLNYSNVSKRNSLLSTSASLYLGRNVTQLNFG